MQVRGKVQGGVAVLAFMLGSATQAQIVTSIKPDLSGSLVVQCTNASKVEAQSLHVLPSSSIPQAGQVVEIYLTIRNICNGPLNIPWQIKRFGETIASGVQQNVAAGQSFEATTRWTAVAGTHNFFGFADYDNVLKDTGADRMTRYVKSKASYVVLVPPAWPAWGSAAQTGAQAGLRAAIGAASLKGSITNGVGRIERGKADAQSALVSTPMFNALNGAGTPSAVTTALVGAVRYAWEQWAANYEVPAGLLTWPSFLAYPHAYAPPTPSTPPVLPLRLGKSGGDGYFAVLSIVNDVKNRLAGSPYVTQVGFDTAINEFAQFLNNRFTSWMGAASLCNILGSGQALGYAPTVNVPTGIVSGPVTAGLCGTY